MDVGFKLKLKTPNGITGRINHHMVSQWLAKHKLKMSFDRIDKVWNITPPVNKEQWEDLADLYRNEK